VTNAIKSGISTLLNPFGPQWPSGSSRAENVKPVGEQVQTTLFGKKKPRELRKDAFTEAAEIIEKLDLYRRKFALLAGDEESSYRIVLADGNNAMIDANGKIYFGIHLLLKYKKQMPALIGILAHEIGHRPQRWSEYKKEQLLTMIEMQALCRYEETRADLFAGRALGELEISPQPFINCLLEEQTHPHPEYFPAKMRADVILEGYKKQAGQAVMRRKHWPELDRQTSAKWHVGDF